MCILVSGIHNPIRIHDRSSAELILPCLWRRLTQVENLRPLGELHYRASTFYTLGINILSLNNVVFCFYKLRISKGETPDTVFTLKPTIFKVRTTSVIILRGPQFVHKLTSCEPCTTKSNIHNSKSRRRRCRLCQLLCFFSEVPITALSEGPGWAGAPEWR